MTLTLKHLENGILKPWAEHALDRENGGFYGSLDENWKPDARAPKGLVQHARFLWSFSAAFERLGRGAHRELADHAYAFLLNRFRDPKFGGWYFTVDYAGRPLDARKHVYAQSFVIYAFSQYAKAFRNEDALDVALETFRLVDRRAHDDAQLGYSECFTEDWQEADQHPDFGIQGKRKSMNTHIHMLEAVTTLHLASEKIRCASDPLVEERLRELMGLCAEKIFNPARKSLDLFFEKDWTRLESPTSYGHDIELSWLLHEAGEALGIAERFYPVSIALAEGALRGLSDGEGLYYEGDSSGACEDRRRVWWVQAEGAVGFLNAFALTGEPRFLSAFDSIQKWISDHQADSRLGDWHEEIDERGEPHGKKGHLWKEPYHQSRACLEVERRLQHLSLL